MKIGLKGIKKTYSFFVAILPVLTIYKSPIRWVDLGSFCMLILAVFCAGMGMEQKRNVRTIVKIHMWGIYIAYIIGITCISFLFRKQYVANPSQYMIRMGKNIFYITFTLYISWKGYFESKYAAKFYELIAMVATIVVYVQVLSYILFRYDFVGYSARWAYTEGYKERASNFVTDMFRPTSIFYEPAHYFEYVSILLVLYLFYSKDRKSILYAFFVTGGVLLSTSGQGILFSVMLWGIWMLKQLERFRWKRSLKIEAMFLPVFLMMAVGSLSLSDFGRKAMNRILSYQGAMVTIGGRSDGFVSLKKLSMGELLVGTGYGNYTSVFFSSWPFNLYCLGIVGTAIIVFLYIYCWRHTDKKMLVLLNALMCIFSDVFMGFYFVFFFSFILNRENPNEKKRIFERSHYGNKYRNCNIGTCRMECTDS